MIEHPFGSVSSVWPGGLASWLPTGAPMVNRTALGPSQPISVPSVASTPVFRSPQQAIGPSGSETFGPVGGPLPFSLAAAPLGGAGFGMPILPNPYAFVTPPPAFFGPAAFAPSIPALLMAIAVRRGQPSGPTNDQEIEDFVYDVFELLPGTAEVEVRCEGGRATLTGTVHHKRLKHDVGEIVWGIPGINDVQNNVTITTKRRARPGSREGEQQAGATSRKQA